MGNPIPRSIAGATAIVTGADGELGFAVVERLLRADANVVAHVLDDRNSHKLKSLGNVEIEVGSPANKETAAKAVERAEATFGPVNLLVTCHQRPAVAPLLDMSCETFWEHVHAGVLGDAYFLQEATPSMIRAGWGRVVFTTSAWSEGGKGLAAVATAAGGINILCKTAARELGQYNISVNVVASAFVKDEWQICDASAMGPAFPQFQIGDSTSVAECVRLFCEPRIGAAVAQTIQCSGGFFRHRI